MTHFPLIPTSMRKEVEADLRAMTWDKDKDIPRGVHMAYRAVDGKWAVVVMEINPREHIGSMMSLADRKGYDLPPDLAEIACGLAWRQLRGK